MKILVLEAHLCGEWRPHLMLSAESERGDQRDNLIELAKDHAEQYFRKTYLGFSRADLRVAIYQRVE